jgi:hypothetical protein
LTGYTLQSAQVTLGKIKRKLRAAAESNGFAPLAKDKGDSPATPKKRKNAGDANDTPASKKRTPKKVITTDNASDDEETFTSKHAVKGETKDLLADADQFLGIKSED